MAYRVCSGCSRVIGVVVVPNILAPLGVVYENSFNCPICKIKLIKRDKSNESNS